MKQFSFILIVTAMLWSAVAVTTTAQTLPAKLRVGYNIPVTKITAKHMKYSSSVGVDCIEVNFGGIVDKDRKFLLSDAAIIDTLKKAKKAADDGGIDIWSVHMPFGEHIDISLPNEQERKAVVAMHKRLIQYCKILHPKIILFHPSWFLGLNERELRKTQLIKSVTELNKAVKSIGAIMVVENMLGPQLLRDSLRERPLCRTVEETVEIFKRLPTDVYSAIDLNHIKNPENLIMAMGPRLKTLHVSDGTGAAENHWFPCYHKGKNNWVKILTALNDVHYTGPFLYEAAYHDANELKPCYLSLYQDFVNSLK